LTLITKLLFLSSFTVTEPLAAGTTFDVKKVALVAHESNERMRTVVRIPKNTFLVAGDLDDFIYDW
jgi:hypothetical protein